LQLHKPEPQKEPSPVWAVAWRPDLPTQLAVASARREPGGAHVVFIDTPSMAVRTDGYRAHSEDTLHLAFSPQGRFAASGSRDNTVRVRDLSRPAGEPGSSVRIDGHQGDVWNVAVSPDGRWVASASADSTVRLWRAGQDAAIGLPLLGHTQGVPAVVFSPDGQWLISGSLDGTVRQWPIRLAAPPGSAEAPLAGGPGARLAIARDGRLGLVLPGDGKGTIRLRDEEHGSSFEIDARASAAELPPAALQCPSGDAADAGLAGAGPTSAAAAQPTALALSRDGTLLALGYADGSLRRWDLAARRALGPVWRPSDCGLVALAWSDDGRRLGGIDRAGQLVLLDERGGLLPLNPAGGPAQRNMAGARTLALNADGTHIAIGGVSSERGDRPWLRTLQAGKPGALEFAGKLQADSALAFSRDGQWLFSGDRSGKVRLWNARTGLPVSKPLPAHPGEVAAVLPLADGSGFVSVDQGSFPRAWPAQPAAWPGLLCQKLQANPSRRQWREWVSAGIDYRCVCPGLPIAADEPGAPAVQRCPRS
jgi:WD40 repeat protein